MIPNLSSIEIGTEWRVCDHRLDYRKGFKRWPSEHDHCLNETEEANFKHLYGHLPTPYFDEHFEPRKGITNI